VALGDYRNNDVSGFHRSPAGVEPGAALADTVTDQRSAAR
jgi:hypothetical protein